MRVLSAIAIATGVASVSAGNIPFTLCEKGDAVTITSISTDKTPAPGETINLSASGTSSIAINDGTFDLSVKYLGITVLSQSGNLCDGQYVSLECPVKANTEADVKGTIALPKGIPAGKYTIELHAKDGAGDKLFCADMSLDMAAAVSDAAESVPIAIADDFVAASSTDYEDPKPAGCKSGEMAIQILGVAGDFCSPKCSSSVACPTDVPTGTLATPECVLAAQGSASPTNCALICNPAAAASGCPTGASCKSISGTGICTYDD